MIEAGVRLLNRYPLLLETRLRTLTVLDGSAKIELYLLESFFQHPIRGVASATIFSYEIVSLAEIDRCFASLGCRTSNPADAGHSAPYHAE